MPKKILKDRLRHHGKNGFHRKKKRKKKPDKEETSSIIPLLTSSAVYKVLNTPSPVDNSNMYPAGRSITFG